MSTDQPLHGIVRGRTVELSVDPGLQSGVEVEVILRQTGNPSSATDCGDSHVGHEDDVADFWTEEDDRILAEIQAARESARNRNLPEGVSF